MTRASSPRSGRSGNLKVMGSNPVIAFWTLVESNQWLKLILVTQSLAWRLALLDRAITSWLSVSVRIMRLIEIAGHGASSLVFQWGSTIKSWGHESVPIPLTGLVPQLWSTASYPTGPLVMSSSGAVIVAVPRPVPFLKCAQSDTNSPYTTSI